MKANKSIILYKKNGVDYKICKIIFHKDGSYFVTSPYHKLKRANLFKVKIDYEKEEQEISFDELIDQHSLEDEGKRLKLSHHPDGYLQFSGENIKSGRNEDGTPKGVGIQSWPLHLPPRGPSFGITIKNIKDFDTAGNNKSGDLRFYSDDIVDGDIYDDLTLEGYYIPNNFKSYIYKIDGEELFSMTHPSGVNINLKILRPKDNIQSEGFFGLRVEAYKMDLGNIESGFVLSSSSGEVTIENGKLISGTSLHAFFPEVLKKNITPSLNWS